MRLAHSDRAGLRLLACQIVQHFELREDVDQIIPLLDDHRADLRAAALHTLGLLRIGHHEGPPLQELFRAKLDDNDPSVAITAAWGLTLSDAEAGQKAFQRWFKNDQKLEVQRMAAAALAATGKYGSGWLNSSFRWLRIPLCGSI